MSGGVQGCPPALGLPTLSFPSRVRDRLNPEFLFSALMALMAPDFTSSFACSVAVAVSTGGWSDMAGGGEPGVRGCQTPKGGDPPPPHGDPGSWGVV